MAQNQFNVPLSGLVVNSFDGRLNDNETYRRYVSTVTSTATINSQPSHNSRSVIYELGVRDPSYERDFNSGGDEIYLPFTVTEVINGSLKGIISKYTPFTGEYEMMELSGVLWVLTTAICRYVGTGALSVADIRNGAPIRVRGLNTIDVPANSGHGNVFVPRSISSDYPGIFEAILAAVNHFNVIVYTDVVLTNALMEPIITSPSDGALAMACYYAIRAICGQYEACGAGAIAAFCVTKAIHEYYSVVGHTDEGGYMRTVWRMCKFTSPFGGIVGTFAAGYISLPKPTLNNESTFTAWVDSIALATAGCVAISDPLVMVDGKWFPTIYTSEIGMVGEAGTQQSAGQADAVDLRNRIADTCGNFSRIYVSEISKIFGLSGCEESVITAFHQMFASVPDGERHLMFKTVAPWFWVEPTSLFLRRSDTPAQKHGYGILAGTREMLKKPFFEGAAIIQDMAMKYRAAVTMRTARTSGLLHHLALHRRDGLANIIPRQFLTDQVNHIGGRQSASAARTAGQSINSYLWGRGQSSIISPTEFTYVGCYLGLEFTTATYDQNTGNIRTCHCPTALELQTGMVSFSAHSPVRIENGGLNSDWPRALRRARTTAATSLQAAVDLMLGGYATGGEQWAVGNFEPSVRQDLKQVVVGVRDIERAENSEFLPAEPTVETGRATVPVYSQGPFRPSKPESTVQALLANKDQTGQLDGRGMDNDPIGRVNAPPLDINDFVATGQADGAEV